MKPVSYSVTVTARATTIGWELALDNGRTIQVTSLDDAADRIRTLLDIYQPDMNHDGVAVTLTIGPGSTGVTPKPTTVTPERPAPQPSQPSQRPTPRPAERPTQQSAPRSAPKRSTSPRTIAPSGMECMLWLLSAQEQTATFAEAAAKVFPWTAALPAHSRHQCLGDLHAALRRATDEYVYTDLKNAVASWQQIADGSGSTSADNSAAYTRARPTPPRVAPDPTPTPSSSFAAYPTATHRPSRQASQQSVRDGRHRL